MSEGNLVFSKLRFSNNNLILKKDRCFCYQHNFNKMTKCNLNQYLNYFVLFIQKLKRVFIHKKYKNNY